MDGQGRVQGLERSRESFRKARPGRVLACSVSIVLGVPSEDIRSDPPDPESETPPPKRIEANLALAAPAIDGVLDDSAWQGAVFISDFFQKEPNEGDPATQRTEVAVIYDQDAIYVGARMYSADPESIDATMTRRDDPGTADRLIVSFDTYLDRRTAYSFGVTAAGVRLDWYHPEDNEYDRDETFDPIWDAAVRRTEGGWSAEMRIPFSQLRFNGGGEQVWGLNVNRFIPAYNEDDFWVYVPKGQTGWSSRFGELYGIQNIGSPKRIEFLPYVTSQATFTSPSLVEGDDPFSGVTDVEARLGFNFSMGLGSSLSLDATANPDFGQLEADPAVVNLSAFETFFPERRPFFTESRQSLIGNGADYFYSRRIGAAPHGSVEGDYTALPTVTTILGAAKITGRLPSGLSVGALGALTDREYGQTFDIESGELGRRKVEPMTAYGVLRLEQEIGAEASTAGLMITGVHRSLGTDSLANRLTRQAYAGGVDWNQRFAGGTYEVAGHAGFSHVAGDSAALVELQRTSTHYFQRPDQEHVVVDPTRRSLSGWTASLRAEKISGNWRWDGGAWVESPGFEINDAGRQNQADFIEAWAGVWYNHTEPGRTFRDWRGGVWTNQRWNFGGIRQSSNFGGWGRVTWTNFWWSWFNLNLGLRAQDHSQTRGGPLMETAGWWRLAGGVGGNPANSTNWGVQLRGGGDELGGYLYWGSGNFSVQPSDRIAIAVEPRYMRRADPRQYLATESGGSQATFGERYIFGLIERTEIAAPIRINYSFTPDLSLEVYAEPFAASGRYSEIGELEEPRTFDLRLYGTDGTSIGRDAAGNYLIADGDARFTIDNPDFYSLSFRSNLVLRWEWRPGSTLFVVWQANRADSRSDGAEVGAGSLADAFTSPGDNVLSVKLTYWLPLD